MFLFITVSATLFSSMVLASTIPANRTNGFPEGPTPGSPIEVGVGEIANPGAMIGSEAATNETMEFDFVNLPGYGVIDDANSTVNGSFSCFERRYGYYADVQKDCQMFHLCYPVREPTTQQIVHQRFSFVCSENAVFDQAHLVCVDNDTSPIQCEESIQYYEVSNDRLLESLQATQPGLFAVEEETGDAVNGTASASVPTTVVGTQTDAAASSPVADEKPAGQPFAVYSSQNEFVR
ncbi:uncharacterized protein LOC141858551 [Brevipalpus obovatus]|uniref:uncharacterized protein LOC141858551 n=1 Tax=Brevipalpus obovatus TaxID=246614 RepID=UPI003D9F4F41